MPGAIMTSEMGDELRSLALDVEAFKQSKLHQNAIVRSLEVLGEAASHISADYRLDHPELPWAEMVGMRNRLIHGYNKVSLEIVCLFQYEMILEELVIGFFFEFRQLQMRVELQELSGHR